MRHNLFLAGSAGRVWLVDQRDGAIIDGGVRPYLSLDFRQLDSEPSFNFAHRVHAAKDFVFARRKVATEVSTTPASYTVLSQESLSIDLGQIVVLEQ